MNLLSGAEIQSPLSVLEKVGIIQSIEFFFKENILEFCQDIGNCPQQRGVRTERDSTAFEKKKNKMSKTVVIQTSETSQMYQDFCVRLRKTTVP